MEIYGLEARRWKAIVFCHSCQRSTNHTLQYAVSNCYAEVVFEGTTGQYHDMWLIWMCDGCNTLTLHEGETDLDPSKVDDFNPEKVGIWKTYPNETIRPKHFRQMPLKLGGIYLETIEAYNNELRKLCAMGLRSIIEGLCDDKQLSNKHDNLEAKIASLTKLGIPATIAENLHGFRFMGNTAAHELIAPEREDLGLAIDIIEDLLNFVYALEYKTSELKRRQKQNPKSLGEDSRDADQAQHEGAP